MNVTIKPADCFSGTVQVPGDKSISHRAMLIASMAAGQSEIFGALTEGDCASTLCCLRELGVDIKTTEAGKISVIGKGRFGFHEPEKVLDVGNSGTTLRLLLGILAGQQFTTVLTGDSSLRQRPMGRVTIPLREMGALIVGRAAGEKAPLAIRGCGLKPLVQYPLAVASAQVKSALLLAGCYTDGKHSIIEKADTRDHTEIMLAGMGVTIQRRGYEIEMEGGQNLTPGTIRVPGDFSSAAFLIAVALLIPGSWLQIEKVGLNPTRVGFLDTAKEMGARITVSKEESWNGEKIGTITVESSLLQGTVIPAERIPLMIDELPILTVLAAYAQGETIIHGAEELRLKESDRIRAMATELSKMDADIWEKEDGLVIRGKRDLAGATLHSHHDHRIAMSLIVAALRARSPSVIEAVDCIRISYPEFLETVAVLTKGR